MFERVSALAAALSLCATVAMAQPATTLDARGTVVRYDASYNVIVLDDGRMYRVTPNTMVLVNNQAVPVTSVQPGLPVIIQSGEAVMLQNGRYVVAAPPAAVAPAAPTAVVTAVPATALKQTIYGKVTDVDRDGDVKIKTDDGAFKVTLTRESARQIKEGDTVVIDATFAPRGTQIIR